MQRKRILATVLSIVAVMVVFFGLFLNKVLREPPLTREKMQDQGVILFDPPRIIKPFTLLNQHGDAFGLDNFLGKNSLIFFGFTHCPDICPTELAELSRLHQALSAENRQSLQIILVSLDPARDTVDVLKPYLEYFNPEFIGLTGDFPDIMRLSNNVNVAFNKVPQGDSYTIDHTSHIVYVNSRGHYAGFIKTPFRIPALKTFIEGGLFTRQW